MGNELPKRLAVNEAAERCSRRALLRPLNDARNKTVRRRNTQLAFLSQRANEQSANGPHGRIRIDAHRLTGCFNFEKDKVASVFDPP